MLPLQLLLALWCQLHQGQCTSLRSRCSPLVEPKGQLRGAFLAAAEQLAYSSLDPGGLEGGEFDSWYPGKAVGGLAPCMSLSCSLE